MFYFYELFINYEKLYSCMPRKQAWKSVHFIHLRCSTMKSFGTQNQVEFKIIDTQGISLIFVKCHSSKHYNI